MPFRRNIGAIKAWDRSTEADSIDLGVIDDGPNIYFALQQKAEDGAIIGELVASLDLEDATELAFRILTVVGVARAQSQAPKRQH